MKKGLPFILTAPTRVSATRSGLRQTMARSAQQKSRTLFRQREYTCTDLGVKFESLFRPNLVNFYI